MFYAEYCWLIIVVYADKLAVLTHDHVFAFDMDTGTELWKTALPNRSPTLSCHVSSIEILNAICWTLLFII